MSWTSRPAGSSSVPRAAPPASTTRVLPSGSPAIPPLTGMSAQRRRSLATWVKVPDGLVADQGRSRHSDNRLGGVMVQDHLQDHLMDHADFHSLH